jgi:uracil phosphoribosyltransferase
MVVNLSDRYSVLCDWIAEIRDAEIQKDPLRFRFNMERIGEVAAYEISSRLKNETRQVATPLGVADCRTLNRQPVLATILRAGIPLHGGLARFFDRADHAFAGAYRKHRAGGGFDISLDYLSCPPLAGRDLILADPMLATGASLIMVLTRLLQSGTPAQIHIVSAIAAAPGVAAVEAAFPGACIWAGAVDPLLDGRGYIIPGLGDAGDLAYGSKVQQ